MKSRSRARAPGLPERHPLFVQQRHGEEPYLTIGRVAEVSGASPKAIRHYEALGLIPRPARRGKYRIYSERDVFLVHVLKFGQTLGFRLAELRSLVAGKVEGRRFPLALANALFARKREELEARIEDLRRMLDQLEAVRREMNQRFGA